MVITVFCPEVILARAAVDSYAARISHKEIAKLAEKDGVPWSSLHLHFANIGGFAIRFPDEPIESMSAEGKAWHWRLLREAEWAPVRWKLRSRNPTSNGFSNVVRRYAMRSYFCGDMPWRPRKGNSALADGILSSPPPGESIMNLTNRLLPLRGNLWVLNSWGLLEARKAGVITRLPHVAESDLADRDKGDTLSKLIAVVQVTWLMGQLIERRYYGQPSSQLEIMTLAFAVEAFATYLLLVGRPKGVSTHIYLPAAHTPVSQEDMLRVANTYPHYYGSPRTGMSIKRFHYTIPNGTLHADPANPPRANLINNIGMGAGAVIFGAVHLAAWNFDFPTPIEKQLWRAAAVIVTAFFPAAILMLGLQHFGYYAMLKRCILLRKVIFFVCWHVIGILAVAFVVARLYLLVEGFRSVYYLPTAAFLATAAAEAPRIG